MTLFKMKPKTFWFLNMESRRKQSMTSRQGDGSNDLFNSKSVS